MAVLALPHAAASQTGTASRSVSLGDGKLTLDGPRKGHALACRRLRGSAAAARPWIRRGRYDPARKPFVDGGERIAGASFAIRFGRFASFSGNGLPKRVPAGVFPPVPGDDAARFADGSAAIAGASLRGRFDASPERARRARCVSAGAPVAVALNGVPILPAFDPAGRDAGAREVHDSCGGRTDAEGRYFYRRGAYCLGRSRSRGAHSPQVGWARDGFPLFGPRGRDGEKLTNADLDGCHGHTHAVRVRGRTRRLFHYHVTGEFPYTVGCFRGKPSRSWRFDALAGAPPAPRGPLSITTEPPLIPPFDLGITDYVVRCGGQGVRVHSSSPEGTSVSVDGGFFASGDSTGGAPLDQGQRFSFSVRRGDETTTHHVRCLPDDFPGFSYERNGPPQAEYYLVTPDPATRYVAVFDTNGVPLWWMQRPIRPLDAKLLPNGNLAWAQAPGIGFGDGPGVYEEHELDGTHVLPDLSTVGSHTDFHELEPLANGNYAVLTYRPRDGVDLSAHGGPSDATVLDGEVQELERDGDLVWSWSSKDHIGLEETGRWWSTLNNAPNTLPPPDGRTVYDIVHPNSIEVVGDTMIVSFRHLDALYAISRTSGDILWKLGGTDTPDSLDVLNDPVSYTFGGQHDARLLPDGTLTLHDNQTLLGVPRALRYELDLGAGTATLVEEIHDPEAVNSLCCGGARRLPGGNWVMSWGFVPLVTELSPDGGRVFALRFEKCCSYRANPVLPGQLSRDGMRAGMDVMHPR